MIDAGEYQFNFRGMSFRECWRFGGGIMGFSVALIFKLIAKKGDAILLPPFDNERTCSPQELSDISQKALIPISESLKELGYSRGNFIEITDKSKMSGRLGGAYRALHDNGYMIMFIGFTCTKNPIKNEIPKILTDISICGELILKDNSRFGICDRAYMDSGSKHKSIMIKGGSIIKIATRLKEEAEKRSRDIQGFSNLGDHEQAESKIDALIWESRIKRGLVEKV